MDREGTTRCEEEYEQQYGTGEITTKCTLDLRTAVFDEEKGQRVSEVVGRVQTYLSEVALEVF
jgi:hypothetical protein